MNVTADDSIENAWALVVSPLPSFTYKLWTKKYTTMENKNVNIILILFSFVQPNVP
jgi:hypothetical protein